MLTMTDVKLKAMIELQKRLRQAPGAQVAASRKTFEEHCDCLEVLSSEWRQQEPSGLSGDRLALNRAGGRGLHGLGNKELLEKTVNRHAKIDQRLMSTAKIVEQSKDVTATAEALHRQREHIVEVTNTVMVIENSLQRTQKLTRSFTRRMATDRSSPSW